MNNLLTPIDMLGSLIEPRREGEDLLSYRRRVLRVARVAYHRDMSDPEWLAYRTEELSARLGVDVELRPAYDDAELLAAASERLLTWDRVEERELLPAMRPMAAGRYTLYNMAPAVGSGVGSYLDLELFEDEERRVVATPGMVVIEGQVWYIPARPVRLIFRLPPGTTETAVLPLWIHSDHGHRLVPLSPTRLLMEAEDHTHELLLRDGIWRVEGGPHSHEVRPVKVEGPAFLLAGEALPEIGLDLEIGTSQLRGVFRHEVIDGEMGVPVWNLSGVEVTTDDGKHTCMVDPYDYWSERFWIGDDTHLHLVVPSEDGTALLAQASTPDGHTHTLPRPTIPTQRMLWPLEGEQDAPHPFAVGVTYEHGFAVLRSRWGLGDQLTILYDRGRLLELPVSRLRSGETLGIGPLEDASRVVVVSQRVRSGAVDLVLRTEDRYTGGVPRRVVALELAHNEGVQLLGVWRSDDRALVRLTLPELRGELRFYLVRRSGLLPAGTLNLDMLS